MPPTAAFRRSHSTRIRARSIRTRRRRPSLDAARRGGPGAGQAVAGPIRRGFGRILFPRCNLTAPVFASSMPSASVCWTSLRNQRQARRQRWPARQRGRPMCSTPAAAGPWSAVSGTAPTCSGPAISVSSAPPLPLVCCSRLLQLPPASLCATASAAAATRHRCLRRRAAAPSRLRVRRPGRHGGGGSRLSQSPFVVDPGRSIRTRRQPSASVCYGAGAGRHGGNVGPGRHGGGGKRLETRRLPSAGPSSAAPGSVVKWLSLRICARCGG